jgi:tellurite resistance protein
MPNLVKKTLKAAADSDLSAEELKRAAGKLGTALKKAESKYKEMDPKTKKKMMTGIAAAAALVATAIGAQKANEKRKEKKVTKRNTTRTDW